MQGSARGALDILRADGSMLPCLVNAVELRDDDGRGVLVRATLFEATARRRYERELLAAQRAAEESGAVADGAAGGVRPCGRDLGGGRRDGDRGAQPLRPDRAGGGAWCSSRTRPPSGCPAGAAAGALGRVVRGLLAALHEAASGQLALELAQGVRSVPLDERLRATQPGVAEAMAAEGLSTLVIVPVTADSRRWGS